MRVLLFTDSKPCVAGFGAIAASRSHELEVMAPSTIKQNLDGDSSTFVYLDVTGLSVGIIRSRCKLLVERMGPRFGIVDRNGTVGDIAEVFHRGASDYVDNRLLKGKLTAARFTRVIEQAVGEEPQPPVQPPLVATNIRPSGTDWIGINEGEEYTFQMIYVGLDHVKDIRRKSSEDLLRNLRKTLQNIVTQAFSPTNGRIWMWKEDEGVLLCPFDGERVTSVAPTTRLALNRLLINAEQFSVNMPVSWRMGIHIGNSTYQAAGQTGAVVSESLNFIFHLGQRALSPGQFAVTESAFSLLSPRVQDCFVEGPVFESLPVHFLREII